MTEREIKKRIRTAVEHASPNQLNDILFSCDKADTVTQAPQNKKGAITTMNDRKRSTSKKRKSGLAAIAAVAAALVLCVGGYSWFQKNRDAQIDSVIMLDVNPSLTLHVDAQEMVRKVEAGNEDAKGILGTMDLTDTSLEVAVNAIIGAMMQKGYLGDLQNSILVSVENKDTARGTQIQQKVSQAIAAAVHTDTMDAAVLSQTVNSEDAQLAALAQQYQISMGKAALIQEVIAQDPTLTFEALVPMTINEIALIASSKHMESQTITQTGTASEKAYIGQEEALKNACAHAGITTEEAQRVKIEFDSDDGLMVYEVEFETDEKEYEYDINALTGEVVKHEVEDRDGRGNASSENANPQSDKNENHSSANDTNGKTEQETAAQTQPAASNSGSSGKTMIGEAAAKQAALSHAGVSESEVTYIHCDIDYDDGIPENYDVEFVVGNMEYDYEIDLYSGAVIEAEKEPVDD